MHALALIANDDVIAGVLNRNGLKTGHGNRWTRERVTSLRSSHRIARCATCGGGMTLRTGKGGRYRYYACHNSMHKGKTHCGGRSIPMPVLDDLVVSALEEKILAPERLQTLLSALVTRMKDRGRDHAAKAASLRKELAATEGKIERLYDALAEGVITDNDLFRKSLARHEAQRNETLSLIAGLERQREVPRKMLGKANIARFAAAARAQIRADDPRLRKGYVRHFVEHVEVDDGEITLRGAKAALASGLLPPPDGGEGGVPGFVPEWWRTQSRANPSLPVFPASRVENRGNLPQLSARWAPGGAFIPVFLETYTDTMIRS